MLCHELVDLNRRDLAGARGNDAVLSGTQTSLLELYRSFDLAEIASRRTLEDVSGRGGLAVTHSGKDKVRSGLSRSPRVVPVVGFVRSFLPSQGTDCPRRLWAADSEPAQATPRPADTEPSQATPRRWRVPPPDASNRLTRAPPEWRGSRIKQRIGGIDGGSTPRALSSSLLLFVRPSPPNQIDERRDFRLREPRPGSTSPPSR
jgi:hypothetical protein